VAGDRDGALLGEHAIAAEIAGEFGGGDGLRFCHIVIPREKRKSRKLRKTRPRRDALAKGWPISFVFPAPHDDDARTALHRHREANKARQSSSPLNRATPETSNATPANFNAPERRSRSLPALARPLLP
jgi:hypothetical protein